MARRRLPTPEPKPTHTVPSELVACVVEDWIDEVDHPSRWPAWMRDDSETIGFRLTLIARRRHAKARRAWQHAHPDVPVPVSRPRWHDAGRVLRMMGG